MVLGEASESDEDSDAPTEFTIGNSSSILASTLMSSQKTTKKPPNKHKLKYNTLLHYKLRNKTNIFKIISTFQIYKNLLVIV